MKKRFLWVIPAVVVLLIASLGPVAAQNGDDLTPMEKLGRAIFFDVNLSINQNQSCASCHGPEAGWTGPDSAINGHGAVYEGSIPVGSGTASHPVPPMPR